MSKKRGNLFIISAPSGAGKTTLVKTLLEMVPSLFLSISHTTRGKRPHETDGIHYHFVDKTKFLSLASSDRFLEYAEVFGNYYGTSKSWVEKYLVEGKDIILEIDWQGAIQVKKQIQNTINIFILPPSYDTLQSRLLTRGDSDKAINNRMKGARNEIVHYNEYDFIVINDDFQTTMNHLKNIFVAMKQGYMQQKEFYDDFVADLLNDS